MAQQILLIPAHANTIEECEAKCLQAVTFAEDKQWFRSNELLAVAYRKRNKFPVGTYAYKLCQNAITKAQQELGRMNQEAQLED
jgi:hypothetical protein